MGGNVGVLVGRAVFVAVGGIGVFVSTGVSVCVGTGVKVLVSVGGIGVFVGSGVKVGARVGLPTSNGVSVNVDEGMSVDRGLMLPEPGDSVSGEGNINITKSHIAKIITLTTKSLGFGSNRFHVYRTKTQAIYPRRPKPPRAL